jgi:hypothetical protein
MTDVFISHSSADEKLAVFIKEELAKHHVKAFLAKMDLRPGEEWTTAIWEELDAASWVIFLASKAACESPYVQQELGMALAKRKEIVPVVWDQDPSELPGWMNRYQAVDFRERSVIEMQDDLAAIAERIKDRKAQGYLVLGAIALGLLCRCRLPAGR